MTENIKNIFEKNIKLLGDMDKSVYCFREQQYYRALGYVADSFDHLKLVIEAIITDRDYFKLVSIESILKMLTDILEAMMNDDFILLADLLELQLMNFLIEVQELIISKEEILFDEENYENIISLLHNYGECFLNQMKDSINTEQLLESGYRIEVTSCGQMILAAKCKEFKFFLHTNNRIQTEAFILARQWYQENKTRYIIYGFGMGYHIHELQSIAKEAEIEVYESDLNVLRLACAFTNVEDVLSNNKIKLIFDPELELLKERMNSLTEEDSLLIHYPSYLNIKKDEVKEILQKVLPWVKVLEKR
jgi:hypothetical protein